MTASSSPCVISVQDESHKSGDDARSSSSCHVHRKQTWAIAVIAVTALLLVVFQGSLPKLSSIRDITRKTKMRGSSEEPTKDDDDCFLCRTRVQEQHIMHWHGADLVDMMQVRGLVKAARDRLVARLQVEYGEDNFNRIFRRPENTTLHYFLPATTGGPSVTRFKRKLKLKVLSMQMAVQHERDQQCDCTKKEKSHRRRRLDHSRYERFVWATGGHSAAAGHGNLWNESYTAVLDGAVKDVFRSIGIDFEGRNYAMRGTSSAPEIALCLEAIFGVDADVITWDYGMTDADHWFRKPMYEERVGLHPNRPMLLDINILKDEFGEHIQSIQSLEERGIAALYLDPVGFKQMKEAFPDTFGKTMEQINAMPRLVRHFKCRYAFEKGDPTCDYYKYDNNEVCPDREGMVDWHPGWKMMALWGNTFALFLADLLVEVIEEMENMANNTTQLLHQLQSEEDKDYETFFSTVNSKVYDMVPMDDELVNKANTSVFFREPSICRTARLPSESRYLGIYKNENQQSGGLNYDEGISMTQARNLVSNASAPMPLVFDESERQDSCEYELQRDYNDFFITTSKQEWATLTVPNDAEHAVYGRESQKLLGIVVLCLLKCPWDDCPEGNLQADSIQNGTVQMQVNGQPVTNFTDLTGCIALRGENGHYWKPNGAGQFVLRARISNKQNDSPFSYLRISSIIVL